MTDPIRSDEQARLIEYHIKEVKELANLGGVHIKEEALTIILELLASGAPPSSLKTVLEAICKPLGGAKRQSASSTTTQ
jgi:hypothetical protein